MELEQTTVELLGDGVNHGMKQAIRPHLNAGFFGPSSGNPPYHLAFWAPFPSTHDDFSDAFPQTQPQLPAVELKGDGTVF